MKAVFWSQQLIEIPLPQGGEETDWIRSCWILPRRESIQEERCTRRTSQSLWCWNDWSKRGQWSCQIVHPQQRMDTTTNTDSILHWQHCSDLMYIQRHPRKGRGAISGLQKTHQGYTKWRSRNPSSYKLGTRPHQCKWANKRARAQECAIPLCLQRSDTEE